MSGTWMQRIAQDWLVLTLSHSVAASASQLPCSSRRCCSSALRGLIVDRYSKRMLLMLTQGASGVLATLLAVLALTHTIEVWHVWAIAFVVGLVTVVDNPTRQVFVNELVGPRNLRNAISINSSVFQLGGLIGPAIAGILLTAVGAGWAFAINAGDLRRDVLTLAASRNPSSFAAPQRPRQKGQLQQGLAYVLPKADHPLAYRHGCGAVGLRAHDAGDPRRIRQ